jgi:acylphosphatase
MTQTPPHKRAHLVFEGRVQGVLFRANTQRIARELKLTGWVRNLEDGSVEAVVEGPQETIRTLIDRLGEEVRAAAIKRVRETWSAATAEFSKFEIRGRF